MEAKETASEGANLNSGMDAESVWKRVLRWFSGNRSGKSGNACKSPKIIDQSSLLQHPQSQKRESRHGVRRFLHSAQHFDDLHDILLLKRKSPPRW